MLHEALNFLIFLLGTAKNLITCYHNVYVIMNEIKLKKLCEGIIELELECRVEREIENERKKKSLYF